MVAHTTGISSICFRSNVQNELSIPKLKPHKETPHLDRNTKVQTLYIKEEEEGSILDLDLDLDA